MVRTQHRNNLAVILGAESRSVVNPAGGGGVVGAKVVIASHPTVKIVTKRWPNNWLTIGRLFKL